MESLDRDHLVSDVYNLLAHGQLGPLGSTDWQDRARRYLTHCAKLYAEDQQRCGHIQHIQRLATVISLLRAIQRQVSPSRSGQSAAPGRSRGGGGNGGSRQRARLLTWEAAAESLDPDGILVALRILGWPKTESSREVRKLLSERFKTLFEDPANLGSGGHNHSTPSLFDRVVGLLEDPVHLSKPEFRAVVEHVRLVYAGRTAAETAQALRGLVVLWRTTPEGRAGGAALKDFADALAGLAADTRAELRDLAFELLLYCDDRERLAATAIARIAKACAEECADSVQGGHGDMTKTVKDWGKLLRPLLELVDRPQGEPWMPKFQGRLVLTLDELLPSELTPDQQKLLAKLFEEVFGLPIRPGGQPASTREELTHTTLSAARRECFEALGRATVPKDKSAPWRETVFEACRSSDPRGRVGDYLFRLLGDAIAELAETAWKQAWGAVWLLRQALTITSTLGKDDFGAPEPVENLLRSCALLFEESRFERLVGDLLKMVHKDDMRDRKFLFYMGVTAWAGRLLARDDPRRELLATMQAYYVVQKVPAHYTTLVDLCMELVIVLCDPELVQERCRRLAERIQEFHNRDSGMCPAGAGAETEKHIKDNLEIVRSVINRLKDLEQKRTKP